MSDRDAYGILGLAPNAADEVVRFAYLELARRHHPDHGGDGRDMERINNAYQHISIERGWKVRALAAAASEGTT